MALAPAGGAARLSTAGSPASASPRTSRTTTRSSSRKVPGAAHLHQFFGNTTTQRALDAAQAPPPARHDLQPRRRLLRRTGCRRCSIDGAPSRRASSASTTSRAARTARALAEIPKNLEMLAGEAHPTVPQSPRSPTGPARRASSPSWSGQPRAEPHCPLGSALMLNVYFPDCWDGVNLDSIDHTATWPTRRQRARALDRVVPDVAPGADAGDRDEASSIRPRARSPASSSPPAGPTRLTPTS